MKVLDFNEKQLLHFTETSKQRPEFNVGKQKNTETFINNYLCSHGGENIILNVKIIK